MNALDFSSPREATAFRPRGLLARRDAAFARLGRGLPHVAYREIAHRKASCPFVDHGQISLRRLHTEPRLVLLLRPRPQGGIPNSLVIVKDFSSLSILPPVLTSRHRARARTWPFRCLPTTSTRMARKCPPGTVTSSPDGPCRALSAAVGSSPPTSSGATAF